MGVALILRHEIKWCIFLSLWVFPRDIQAPKILLHTSMCCVELLHIDPTNVDWQLTTFGDYHESSRRHDSRFQKSEVGSCRSSYQLVGIGRTYGNFQLLISENEGHVFSNPL